MAKLFNKTTNTAPSSPREILQNKYNSSRANLLLIIAFTVINIVLLFVDGSSYFLFSIFVPYFIASIGMLLTGKLPQEVYEDGWDGLEFFNDTVLYVMLFFAAVILLVYLLCWFFSKKSRVGWLISALVLFCIDTALLFLIQGIDLETIIDIIFHIWVIVSLANGIVAYFKLKKLPEEDPTNEENGEFAAEAAPQSTPILRMADLDAKCKVLLETEKDGFVITYHRVKKVNELVINNIVYDEYEAIIESPHNLCVVVSNRTIEAGYDGARSYIKVDGKIIAKKLRLI